MGLFHNIMGLFHNIMGLFHNIKGSELDNLNDVTGIDRVQIALHYHYFKKKYPHGYMKMKDFLELKLPYDTQSRASMEAIFRSIDGNNDGKISFEEYILWFGRVQHPTMEKDE